MMICDQMRERIPDFLAGRLDPATRQKLIDHLDTCSACRAEVADLGVVWRGLGTMPEPEPSQAMRARFRESLAAYEEGYQDAQRRQAMAVPARPWWAGWWPSQPAWQMALSAVLVVAAAVGGRQLAGPQTPPVNPEIAQLKGQVENLRQMVALSLLQEQSASARLRGVAYSDRVAQPDTPVQQALLRALTHDDNVNIRLSAVDALARFAGNPEIRRALVDAIPVQQSPLVQIALIDLLVQAQDKDAAPALRKMAQDPNLDDAVRQRAASGLEKIGAGK